MSTVSPFRLFGRAPEGPAARLGRAAPEVPDLDDDLDNAFDREPGSDANGDPGRRRAGPDDRYGGRTRRRPRDGAEDRGGPHAAGSAVGWAAGPWTPGSDGVPRTARTRHARPGTP
ncbi:MAG TPA: hypothetical protein VF667_00895, partial [Pseudonocardia sp.]